MSPYLRYGGRRLAQGVPVVLGMVVFNFLLLHLAPGNAADVLAGESGSASPEFMAQLRRDFDLDKPLAVQLVRYVEKVFFLDLGYSYRNKMQVRDLVIARLPATLLLMLTAIALAVWLGVLLGVAAARYHHTWVDNAISVFALLAFATPIFWIGLMLIVVFALQLGWLPTNGMADVSRQLTGVAHGLDVARHLILPAVTLALFYVALYARLTRASMLEVYGLEYVRVARAKGLADRTVAIKHVLRNALLSVVTMIGTQAGQVLGGSVLVETVFGWPGLGRLAIDALLHRDLNVLLGLLFLSSILVVVANVVTDLAYTMLDPTVVVR